MFASWCPRCQIEKLRWKKRFDELIDAIWRGEIRRIVEILSANSGLANYHGFTFHLPGENGQIVESTSILDYAKVMRRKAVIEVLIGFGAC